MVKAEKRRKSSRRRIESGSEDEEQKTLSQLGVGNVIDDGGGGDDDDDDAEANEDLSLKIVEKAMLRKCSEISCSDSGAGNVADLGDDYEIVTNLADDESEEKEIKKAKRRRVDAKKGKKVESKLDSASSEKDAKNENFCSDLFQVDVVKEERNVESEKALQVDNEAVRTNPVEVADNLVLRKLLRGPRYFDPPDSSWSTCYNCGEEGHMAVNCTLAKRKKPCFLCGSLEHPSRSCPKGKEKDFCYFCIQGGHRARDCPEKSKRWKTSKFCLKCGDSGHDMFSCGNNYFSDDLKLIQCYVCGSFGHLCCVDDAGTFPRKVTCYRCGLSGHTGLACKGSKEDTPNKGSASSCYKCGELGHFSRECTNSAKAWKGSHKQTPKKISASKCYKCGQPGHFSRDCSNSVKASANSCYHCGEQGHFSHDCTYSAKVFISGNKASASSRYHCGEQGHFSRDCTYSARKSGKRNGESRTPKHRTSKHDERWMKASKSKQKLGWTTEDPGEASRWSSPKTPSGKRFRTSSDRRWLGGSGGTWSSWSSRDC